MPAFEIAIIGTGNLAIHLTKRLRERNNPPAAILSRSKEKAEGFIREQQLDASCTPDNLFPDIIILAVPDQHIQQVVGQYIFSDNAIWLHCSGGSDLSVFGGQIKHYGVLYPLQSFTSERALDFTQIPVLVEGSSKEVETRIIQLATLLSEDVRCIRSEDRLKIHLAAIFANNFTNSLLTIAEKALSDTPLKLTDLEPLVRETIEKAFALSPERAQTGPARRGDRETILKHLSLLSDEEVRELYLLHSRFIQKL